MVTADDLIRWNSGVGCCGSCRSKEKSLICIFPLLIMAINCGTIHHVSLIQRIIDECLA